MKCRWPEFAVFLALVAGSSGAAKAQLSTSEVQLHYGDGYRLGGNGLGTSTRSTVTFEHLSKRSYGDFFGFLDITRDYQELNPATDKNTYYGEAFFHLSARTLGVNIPSDGLIADFGPSVGINKGEGVTFGLIGGRANLRVPGFRLFSFQAYVFETLEDPFGRNLDTTYQLTFSFDRPFELAGQKFLLKGFTDYIGARGLGTAPQHLIVPQFRWDIGYALGGRENRYALGLEFFHFNNKFGVRGVQDNALSAFLRIKLH